MFFRYGLSLPNNLIPLTSDTAYRFNNKSVKIVLNFVGVSVIKCIKIHNGYPVCRSFWTTPLVLKRSWRVYSLHAAMETLSGLSFPDTWPV